MDFAPFVRWQFFEIWPISVQKSSFLSQKNFIFQSFHSCSFQNCFKDTFPARHACRVVYRNYFNFWSISHHSSTHYLGIIGSKHKQQRQQSQAVVRRGIKLLSDRKLGTLVACSTSTRLKLYFGFKFNIFRHSRTRAQMVSADCPADSDRSLPCLSVETAGQPALMLTPLTLLNSGPPTHWRMRRAPLKPFSFLKEI